MYFAKYLLLSLKARLAGAVFGMVASLSMFSAVVVMFASTSGELDPVLARLEHVAPSADASTQVAKFKPASPASEAVGKPPGNAGSG